MPAYVAGPAEDNAFNQARRNAWWARTHRPPVAAPVHPAVAAALAARAHPVAAPVGPPGFVNDRRFVQAHLVNGRMERAHYADSAGNWVQGPNLAARAASGWSQVRPHPAAPDAGWQQVRPQWRPPRQAGWTQLVAPNERAALVDHYRNLIRAGAIA